MTMQTCPQCSGEGYTDFYEDGRLVYEPCYHCGTTGKIDEETHYHNQLEQVATEMAIAHVQAYKKEKNSDPYGEGFDFSAAENMMSSYEYERSLVYDYIEVFAKRLATLPREEQKAYVDKLEANEKIEPLYEGEE